MRRRLSERDLIEVLAAWAGAEVAVRVVVGGDELLAVVRGRLGRETGAKRPALFWGVETGEGTSDPTRAETPGVYLHPHLLAGAWLHVGASVVEWRQADVVVNVRRV